ncbi:MAG TPA: extracellular solute-binding protein [Acidimicrobiales bacterium]|nr:extracellular solute-binding protein [Acidimicrobiales bacterium]
MAAMAAVAAACGSSSTSSGGGSSSGPSLQQWYHEYGEKGTEQAAKQFAASYKKARVAVQWTPGDYATKLSAGLLSSSGPDVYESQFNVQMARSKQAVPLDDIIAPYKHDFNAYDIKANTYDGHTYGVRIIDDPQFFYYRKSLFDKKGLKPPETLDDLISIAKELTTSSMKGIFLGNDAGAGAMAGPALWSTAQRYLTPDHKVGFDSPRTGEVFQKLRQLQTDKSILLGAPTDWTDEGSFTNQLCAIQWCGLWGMPTIKSALGDDFDVFPFPKFDSKGQDVVYSGGWTEFVNGKSHHIEAAKEYVKYLWLTSTKIQEQWALDYGYHIPPRISVAAGAKPLQSGPAKHAVELAKTYGVGDEPYWTPNVSVGYGDMVTNILRKGQAPGPQISKAASIATKALKQLGV